MNADAWILDSVTECVGGSMRMSEEELPSRYQSFCDPRLNFEQSLGACFLLILHHPGG